MTEGSWVLRCRCKHKHTDHDPNTRACNKPQCKCTCFDSPWVCNCDHAWADHEHLLVEKEVQVVVPVRGGGAGRAEGAHAADALELGGLRLDQGVADDVNNYDALRRGSAGS